MPAISRQELRAFLRQQPYAVQASISKSNAPQAALIGIVVSDQFELFFDTLGSTRKAANLRITPAVAFVIGSMDSAAVRAVQYEGVADEPAGDELDRFLALYFDKFPDDEHGGTGPT